MANVQLPKLVTEDKRFEYKDFGGGYNSRDPDIGIADNELSGGQDVDINPDKALAKRQGHTLIGEYMGNTTGIQGLIVHEPQGGTTEFLAGYDVSIRRRVGNLWTALTSVTMTTAKQLDSAYFPLTSKTYIVNGTDAVVKYTSGTSGDQSDTAFKKGKYIIQFKNRLLTANVSGQEDYVWYTDLGVDTFSTNNYMRALGEVTGLEVLYDKFLTFTKRKVFVTQNFTFNGSAAGPESFIPLPTDFGAIYDRTIAKVGNLVFFLGQDSQGIAAIYVTDGYNIQIISEKIDSDLNDLSPSSLVNAAASAWGRFYRIAVTLSGQSVNTKEYLYDTVNKRWLPPYNVQFNGISCYATVESSGQLDVYAGSQSDGRVYKLNQVNYDETIDQSLATGQDSDGPVDADPALRAAQSFKLSAASTRSVFVTGAAVLMKKNAGTTTDLTLRIETNSGAVPSGTLADTNLTGTISAFSTGSYVWKTVKFSTPAEITGNTPYWIVLQHATEGSGDSQYYWGYDASSPAYTNGNGATFASAAWTAQAGRDYLFVLFIEDDIDGYGDTKAFYHGPIGQLTHLKKIYVTAKAIGNWTIQAGVNTGVYSGFTMDDMSLAANGPIFGSTFVMGSSVLGGQNRVEELLTFPGTRGKTIKYRFRNQYANQPFTVYSFRTQHEILNKIK